MKILLLDLPFPPSINRAYRARRKGNKTWVSKSHEYVEYDRAFGNYVTRHAKNLLLAKQRLTEVNPKLIKLTVVLNCPKSRLFSLKGTVKAFDGSNFVKVIEDKVAHVLQFNDKTVFELHVFKCISAHNESWADIVIEDLKDTPSRDSILGYY